MNRFLLCTLLMVLTVSGCTKKSDEDTAPKPEGPMAGSELHDAAETTRQLEPNAVSVSETGGKKSAGNQDAPTPALVMEDLDRSLHEVARKSMELDADEITSCVLSYRQAILGKQNELEGLKEQIRGLSMPDIVGLGVDVTDYSKTTR
jgi:hypothetical protein